MRSIFFIRAIFLLTAFCVLAGNRISARETASPDDFTVTSIASDDDNRFGRTRAMHDMSRIALCVHNWGYWGHSWWYWTDYFTEAPTVPGSEYPRHSDINHLHSAQTWIGGVVGRWIRVRMPLQGDDLTDAAEDVGVGGNYWRVLPAATPLTASRTKTLITSNAARGDIITITRLGLGNYTMLVVNGGAGAGTLFTLPANEAWWCKSYFDGTNWLAHSAGQMP